MIRRWRTVPTALLEDALAFTAWLDSHGYSTHVRKISGGQRAWTVVEVEVLL